MTFLWCSDEFLTDLPTSSGKVSDVCLNMRRAFLNQRDFQYDSGYVSRCGHVCLMNIARLTSSAPLTDLAESQNWTGHNDYGAWIFLIRALEQMELVRKYKNMLHVSDHVLFHFCDWTDGFTCFEKSVRRSAASSSTNSLYELRMLLSKARASNPV